MFTALYGFNKRKAVSYRTAGRRTGAKRASLRGRGDHLAVDMSTGWFAVALGERSDEVRDMGVADGEGDLLHRHGTRPQRRAGMLETSVAEGRENGRSEQRLEAGVQRLLVDPGEFRELAQRRRRRG
jgi:hypothetical protein